jgi:1-deoxy-D-xylulose-5-phosphate synthase
METHPIVIRYPKANTYYNVNELDFNKVGSLEWKIINNGSKAIVISYGEALNRINNVVKSNDLDVTLVNALSIKPIDKVILKELFDKNLAIIVIEEVVNSGSLYSKIIEFKEEHNYSQKIKRLSFDVDTIVTHGKTLDVLNHYGMSDENILKLIKELI